MIMSTCFYLARSNILDEWLMTGISVADRRSSKRDTCNRDVRAIEDWA